jgi:type VI secretion system protein ImpG
MNDDLLPYYNRELTFIRRLGAEFAEAHPKIAGRLRLGPDVAEDPHVERLIEAFAYLNARTRLKLDDDFPELTDALLGVLYPHYQAPVPSMAVVQFTLDHGQADLVAGYTIPRETALETDPIDGEPCRFHTCYPTSLWPIELTAASLTGRPLTAPATRHTALSSAVLRLQLQCYGKEMTFSKLSIDSLRFFLRGQSQHVFALYELIFNNTLGVALASSPNDRDPILLGPQCIRPVGFERDEGMLPWPSRSFLGYRILSEYFAFPQKFLFFDITGLDRRILQKAGNRLELYLYLNRTSVDLEQNVTESTFQLGCTPIINLYKQRAEPVILNHTQTEYRVTPDARRPLANEVYSIDRVTATSPDNEQIEYRPFYSFKHSADRRAQKAFWHAVRRPAERCGGEVDPGTEVYLSLVDLGFKTSVPNDWTLDVETTCLNRDLPRRLPWQQGASGLHLTKGAPISRVECVTGRPTATRRPALKRGAAWRLVSHLSLNHLSLADHEEGADALREILKLYDFADSAETQAMIEGILSVRSRRVVGRVPGGVQSGFCRGIEVTLHFDEDRFAGSGLFLFACVLERFLGLYCSVNSFSKLVATTNKREGELRKWPPRAAETVLL